MTPDISVNTTSTTESNPIIDHVCALLAVPGSQVNLELRGNRYRLRYREMSAGGIIGRRKGLELPQDTALIATIEELIEDRRRHRGTSSIAANKRQVAAASQELDAVLHRILAACPRGRVIRRRIRLVFGIAAELGFDTLMDFIKRKPWLAKPMPAGRPRK